VRELLNNQEGTATFRYAPPPQAPAAAGATHRAVSFGSDLGNVFRFARLHREVTIVKGTSPYHAAAAERLGEVLRPWDVRCRVVDVAEASKPRPLAGDEVKTWVGLVPARATSGAGNPPAVAGFAVRGPVLLLGNPDDNTIIRFLQENHFLPYRVTPGSFPGPGRGLIAWQRDGVGHGQESVTLIAHDAEGLAEAVGSFYEAVAGLEPLTRWELPKADSLTPARSAPGLTPAAAVAWAVRLPDRVVGMKVAANGLTVLTHDGSIATVSGEGKLTSSKPVEAGQAERVSKELAPAPDRAAEVAARSQARPDRLFKLAAARGGWVAVAYWGGTLRVVDGKGQVRSEQLLPQDITALAWLDGKVVAGLADGQVLALRVE
jgi:hypothetical protein